MRETPNFTGWHAVVLHRDDGNAERLTEMDALVAYLQIIGGLTDAAKKTKQTALGE